jgi:hypothetical protein
MNAISPYRKQTHQKLKGASKNQLSKEFVLKLGLMRE